MLQLMHKDRQGCNERLYFGGKILRPQNLNPFWFTKIHVFKMWTLFEEFLDCIVIHTIWFVWLGWYQRPADLFKDIWIKNNQVTRVTAKECWVVWNVEIIVLLFPSKPDHFKTPQVTNRVSTPDPTAPSKARPTALSVTKHLAPMLEQATKSAL